MRKEPKDYKKIEIKKSAEPPKNILEIEEIEEEESSEIPNEELEADLLDLEDDNDDENEPESLEESDQDDDDGDKEEEDEKEEEAEKELEETKKEEKRKRDSASRIQELAQFNKKLSKQNQELQVKIDNLLTDKEKNTLESQKTLQKTLQEQAENLQKQLTNAMEEGDSSEVVRIQDDLLETKLSLQKIAQDVEEREVSQKAKAEQPKQEQTEEVSEKALSWIEEHPTFKTDPVFYAAALTVNNVLIDEGYNPDSASFYEELNSRLEPRFPEAFDNRGEDSVQLETDGTPKKEEKEKTPSKKKEKSEYQETVSRTNSRSVGKKSPGKKSSKEKVSITQEEARLAKRWGMSLKEFAEQKHFHSKNKDEDGYAPIFPNR